VVPRLSSASRDAVIESQLGKLAECDETLSLIGSDVTGLLQDFSRLRRDAGHLAQLLSERDVALAEKQLALLEYEKERALALRRTEEVSAALREAESRVREHDERVATLERELHEVRDDLADRERRLAETESELSGMRDAPADCERPSEAASDPPVGHLRFVARPEGYRVSASEDECPIPGALLEIDGRSYVVGGIGRSPLPGDERPCAFLLVG